MALGDLSIGRMAEAGGCKVQTIRYYEEIGILPEPRRSAGNQRIYAPEHLDRVRFIRHSRDLGFSIDQIRELLALSDDPNRPCGEVDAIARAHLKDVERKIARLEGFRTELKRMITSCTGGKVEQCRIIDTLSDHSKCLTKDHSNP